MNVASLLLLMAIGCGLKDSTGPAPKITMRCFDVPKAHYLTHLRVRKPTEDSRDLLLTRALGEKVYFYDHEKRTVIVVDREQWENATGEIIDYTAALKTLDGPMVLETNGKLVFWKRGTGDRVIATKGKATMRVSVSLNQDLVAALTRDRSAEEQAKPSETNYVELFTYPGGEPVGEAFKLPFTKFGKIEVVVWSANDTHLVVATTDQDKICIIELPDVKRQKDVKKGENQ